MWDRRSFKTALLLVFCFLVGSVASGANVEGWFGLGISVEIESFSFSPTLHAIKITKVFPSSPAAAAGLAEGERIVEIQGMAIPGAKAKEVKSAMHHVIGESLHLKVVHGSEKPRSVTLIAIAAPEKK